MVSLFGLHFCLPPSLASRPWAVGAGVTASYVVFYTAYDKGKKCLRLPLLVDFLTLRRGWNWTLVEANKALSLSGITLMLLSMLPPPQPTVDKSISGQKQLLWLSMNMLWMHSLYSIYKFYGFDPRRMLSDKAMKRLSIALGTVGQLTLSAFYFKSSDCSIAEALQYFSSTTLGVASIFFAVGHFWTMEVDYKYVLQVRPFAYLPFPLSAVAVYQLLIKGVESK